MFKICAAAALCLGAYALGTLGLDAQTADGRMLRPNAILHVVGDLDRSVAFYRDMVGLETDRGSWVPPGASRELAALTNIPGTNLRTATFSIPGTETRLVLVNSPGAGASIRPRLQDFGQAKTAFRVRDLDRQFAQVQKGLTGVFTTGGAPIRPEGPQGVNQSVITKDPDGAPVEFVYQTVPPIPETVPATSNVVGGWASLIVDDLPTTIAFYQTHFGFEPRSAGRPATAGLLALQGLPDATTTVSTSAKIPGPGVYSWFLYAYGGVEKKALNGQLSQPGVTAISVFVDNVRGMLTRLKAAGVRVESTGGAPVTLGGTERVFVRDPSGILIELVQEKPR